MSEKKLKDIRWWWMALMCCLLLVSALACVPKAPKERPATLTVQPASGKANTVIVINGSQFLPGEEVEVIMAVGEIYHALGTEKTDTIVADKNGAFEVSSGIPVKTPPGTYKMTATGNKGSVAELNIVVIK
jgi:hypothetical protein